MKAVVLTGTGGPENFKLQETGIPRPGSEDALIRIQAAAFNPIDYQMRQGATEIKLLNSPVLGRELAGEIVALGGAVSGFRIGDRVAAYAGSLGSNGTYAEFIALPAALLAKIPPGLGYCEAAALPMAGMTALQIVKRVPAPLNAPVLVTGGAGGVGTLLIQLLLAREAVQVITTAGNEASIRHLEALGIPPENIINYRTADLRAALRASTITGSFSCVIDLVGGPMSEICAELIEVWGTYVDVTALTTAAARERLFDKATTIVNIANYATALGNGPNRLSYYGTSLAELFQKVEGGELRPANVHIVGDLSADTVRNAHQMMERNETGGRKLVMVV